jgi:DNA-binding MarR family transcriptional regulator
VTDHTVQPTVLRAVRALARVSRLLERASPDLNLAHYRVLSAVAEGDERASRVAARLALGKPTVSAAVDSLGRRGLLQRAGVAGDQRAAALSITPAGRHLLDQVEAEMAARIVDLCDRTPDAARVLDSLAGLVAALDEIADQRWAERSRVSQPTTAAPTTRSAR